FRRRAVGDRFVRHAAQLHPVVASLPAIDAVAHRLTAIADAESRPCYLGDEELVFVELRARDLEQQPRPDAMHSEHAGACLRLIRDDASIWLWVWVGEPACRRRTTLTGRTATTATRRGRGRLGRRRIRTWARRRSARTTGLHCWRRSRLWGRLG